MRNPTLKEQVIETLVDGWSDIDYDDAVKYVAMYYERVYAKEKPRFGADRPLLDRVAQGIVLLAYPEEDADQETFEDEDSDEG